LHEPDPVLSLYDASPAASGPTTPPPEEVYQHNLERSASNLQLPAATAAPAAPDSCVPESPQGPMVEAKGDTQMPGSIRFSSAPGKPNKLAIIMVGLPLRGKTFISLRICRYLVWLGHKTRVFVATDHRRALMQEKGMEYPGSDKTSFYDAINSEAKAVRAEAADSALEDMVDWLSEDGQVAILDDHNVTRERRQHVMQQCHAHQMQVVFIECACFVERELQEKYEQYKETSPDYAGMSDDEATADLDLRNKYYEDVYEPLGTNKEDNDLSYIRVIDGSRQLTINKFGGHLPGRIVGLLMNTHSEPRHIYLSRHGLSEFNTEGRIGGDSPITPQGLQYAQALGKYMKAEVGGPRAQLGVWTSTLQRTKQTAQFVKRHQIEWRALDEINAGICDSMTQEEIAEKYPSILRERKENKATFRYPEGESYLDVIKRLEPIFLGLERQRCPLLVVAHQAVLRVIACYFTDHSPNECAHYPIPMHAVMKLTPHAYGTHVEIIDLKSNSETGDLDDIVSH